MSCDCVRACVWSIAAQRSPLFERGAHKGTLILGNGSQDKIDLRDKIDHRDLRDLQGHIRKFYFGQRCLSARTAISQATGTHGSSSMSFILDFTLLSYTRRGRYWNKRCCKMFSGSSTVVLELPCCQGKQWELSENCLQNLLLK